MRRRSFAKFLSTLKRTAIFQVPCLLALRFPQPIERDTYILQLHNEVGVREREEKKREKRRNEENTCARARQWYVCQFGITQCIFHAGSAVASRFRALCAFDLAIGATCSTFPLPPLCISRYSLPLCHPPPPPRDSLIFPSPPARLARCAVCTSMRCTVLRTHGTKDTTWRTPRSPLLIRLSSSCRTRLAKNFGQGVSTMLYTLDKVQK